MDNSEKILRTTIAKNLGDLVESILRKEPPFNKLPIHKETALGLWKLNKYEGELDNDLKVRFLLYKITSGKFFSEKRLLGYHGESFAKQYPEHMQSSEDFWNWIKTKEGLVNLENDSEPRPIKKATVNKCVKQTFKKRYPEFKLDNKAFGSIGYSQKWGFKNKLYILADTGSWRTTTNFLIGIDYPRFCMDVSEFFADRQSHYGCGYGSVEIVEDGTNKGLDLVDALLPHFSKCIKNAFKKCGLEV